MVVGRAGRAGLLLDSPPRALRRDTRRDGGVGLDEIVFMRPAITVQIAVPDELRGRVMGLYAIALSRG